MRTVAEGSEQAHQTRPQTPLLTTKLSVPLGRPNLVPRPHLRERLSPRPNQRLLLVVAPAGWGKTTLLSQWSNAQNHLNHPCVWLSLDAGDNDPTRFLLYLSAALDTAQPGLADTARTLLLAPQPADPQLVLTVLLNEISALGSSLALVLDDYHLIEAAPIHEALIFLLEHLPPACIC